MNGLAITGIGAVTPVGLSAPASAAAFRAGIARLAVLTSGEVHGPEGAVPMPVGGRVPLEWFEGGPRIQDWPGHERFEMPLPPPDHLRIEDGTDRLVRLIVPAALESCRQALGTQPPPATWGLFLGLGSEEDQAAPVRLVEAVCAALGGFRPAMIETVAEGRAAGLTALHRGCEALRAGKITGAIVGGVDSLIRPTTYERLASAKIVKGPANQHGIIPGEAAACCVLEQAPKGRALATLTHTALAEEPTAGTDKPNQAQGLSSVLRAVRASTSLNYQPLTICDLNGDRYRALEWGVALTRVFGNLPANPESPTNSEFWHPADCIGDAGASSGLVDCVWAVEALRKKYAHSKDVLVWGASEGFRRAAALITSNN